MQATANLNIEGFLKIFDPVTKEILVDKRNAIHYENISEAMAYSLGHKDTQYITELHLGNGGTSVDPTGVITYLPTNTNSQNSDLYNPTYYKIVDNTNVANTDALRNKVEVRHIPGELFTDILITCLLDYGEPRDQAAFDNSQNLDSSYVFDELGIKGWSPLGEGKGKLLTHVVFHPFQKALNRLIEIEYTIRIQSVTNLTSRL